MKMRKSLAAALGLCLLLSAPPSAWAEEWESDASEESWDDSDDSDSGENWEALEAAEDTWDVIWDTSTAGIGEAEPSEEIQEEQTKTPEEEAGDTPEASGEETQQEPAQETEAEPSVPVPEEYRPVLEAAALNAAQYDYDRAIDRLTQIEDYEDYDEVVKAIDTYQSRKESCIAYPLDEITHVFFHTLVVDPAKAFDGDSDSAGYNQYMTTIDEFDKILNTMYQEGYVLVSLHDMAAVNEDGVMTAKTILVPEGKKPFVLSQDDVSYYHYMSGDGFASKLVLDENGAVKNTYVEEDGTVSVGNYDLVPLLDAFVQEHPDFSYHGRKGILAMTGYNGVLGYRTDTAYDTWENLQDDQLAFLEAHPDFDYEEECRQAKEVADAMKAEGWEFASHTWGHKNATESTADQLITDNEKWAARVAPILGSTDMVIFAFGADIGDWHEYSWENPKYAYYYSAGYRYFCDVNSDRYWVQLTDEYLRQGRRNLDGYRMYYNPEMLSDLFDVSAVWDSARPKPVPPI